MTEWISIKKNGKPKEDCTCYVVNRRYSCHCFIAIYDKKSESFVLYDPKMYNHPVLDVTHYVILPSPGMDMEN